MHRSLENYYCQNGFVSRKGCRRIWKSIGDGNMNINTYSNLTNNYKLQFAAHTHFSPTGVVIINPSHYEEIYSNYAEYASNCFTL